VKADLRNFFYCIRSDFTRSVSNFLLIEDAMSFVLYKLNIKVESRA